VTVLVAGPDRLSLFEALLVAGAMLVALLAVGRLVGRRRASGGWPPW
jgi:hypothetical protein